MEADVVTEVVRMALFLSVILGALIYRGLLARAGEA